MFISGKRQRVHFIRLTAAAHCVWEQRTDDFFFFSFFFLATAFSSTWPHYISPGFYCQIIPHLNSVSLYWYSRRKERKTGTMYLYLSGSLLIYLHLSFFRVALTVSVKIACTHFWFPSYVRLLLQLLSLFGFVHHLPLSLSLLPLPSSPCCCSALNMTKERTRQTKVERGLKSSN